MTTIIDKIQYDCIYRGNQPEGRKGTRCRKVAPGVGSYYSSVQIEFEDGAQLLVNRNTVRTVPFRQLGVTQIVSPGDRAQVKSSA